MSITISKDTISRLINDVKTIYKNLLSDNGIYYHHDEEDMLKGYALIVGPEDTPYFGGFYFFELDFPPNYPFSPPKVTFCTNENNIRFNPNLYTSGKVCVSILNTWRGEQWTACQTISTILLSLSLLLCKDPLLNEPGFNKSHYEFTKYTDIIEYANINTAICNIVNKKPSVYFSKFDVFDSAVMEHFLKNYDKILLFLEKKCSNTILYEIKTNIYNMNVVIDYEILKVKFMLCKDKHSTTVVSDKVII
jgi:ubiquitin-protein ligase